MSDRTIQTTEDLRAVLDAVTFAPSCVNVGWTWHTTRVREGAGVTGPDGGWLVRTSFTRPDTPTGKMGVGFGRWEFVAVGASESAVVKTCWLLAELVVRHELMEAFLYRGERLFDPHRTVDELAAPMRRVTRANGPWNIICPLCALPLAGSAENLLHDVVVHRACDTRPKCSHCDEPIGEPYMHDRCGTAAPPRKFA